MTPHAVELSHGDPTCAALGANPDRMDCPGRQTSRESVFFFARSRAFYHLTKFIFRINIEDI